jgi:hypothetical protein
MLLFLAATATRPDYGNQLVIECAAERRQRPLARLDVYNRLSFALIDTTTDRDATNTLGNQDSLGLENIVVVMPAYNAASTLENTFKQFPKDFRAHFILVDDHSQDQTVFAYKHGPPQQRRTPIIGSCTAFLS